MVFGSEIQSWVLGRRVEKYIYIYIYIEREREREDSKLDLWVSGLLSTILEKIWASYYYFL